MKTWPFALLVLTAAATATAAEPTPAHVNSGPARKWEVYILMHSHNDIGYTDIQPNIAKKQAHNVLRALELIQKTKDYPAGARFKWNLEVLMPYEDFHAIATPEQEKEFEQAVRDGNIGVDAMYANLLTGVCRWEELVRQFSFATALGRRCGVKVDSMMISDVPGLTWGVVPALAQYGVKYISDGPNANCRSMEGDRIGYMRVQWEYRPFYWQSPSGREKVLYWGAQGGYSIGHGIPSITAAVQILLPPPGGGQVSLRHRATPLDQGRQRAARRSGHGPVREWNAKYAYPRLIIATTSEAFHEFEKRYGDKLPTYRGDLTPYWEDGAASGARETALNRHSADRLLQAETLWALLSPASSPPPILPRPGRTWPSGASTPGALTTASASPTCLSSRPNGSSSRHAPWMPSGNRGNCWSGPLRSATAQAGLRDTGGTTARGRIQHLVVAADRSGHPAQGDPGRRGRRTIGDRPCRRSD